MQFLLWIHIIAAASWFGAGVALQFGDRIMGAETGTVRAGFYRQWVKLGQILFTPAAVVVLITGVLLVTGSEVYGFGSGFVSIGFLAVIVGAAMGMIVYGPAAEPQRRRSTTETRALPRQRSPGFARVERSRWCFLQSRSAPWWGSGAPDLRQADRRPFMADMTGTTRSSAPSCRPARSRCRNAGTAHRAACRRTCAPHGRCQIDVSGQRPRDRW